MLYVNKIQFIIGVVTCIFRGSEFRTAYGTLAELRTFYDKAPVGLFTATVDPHKLDNLKKLVAWNNSYSHTIARIPDRYIY